MKLEDFKYDEYAKETLRHYLWRQGELSWKLDSLQLEIRNIIHAKAAEGKKKFCFFSSRQIGKSWTALDVALEFCLRHPGIIVRVLADTIKQVSNIIEDNLGPMAADAPPGLIMPSRSSYRWHVGHSSLRLGALDRAHVDGNRGGNASVVIFEEGGFVSSEDYRYAVESVVGPQLLRSNGIELHITSPSVDEYHYIHEEIIPACELLGTFFKYTVYDSPSLTPEQIAKAIERTGGESSEAFQREYMAEIIRSSQLMIVPDFSEARDVEAFELPRYYVPLVSIDGGGIKDKTAGQVMVWDFEKQRLLVWDEFLLEPNTPSSEIVQASRALESQVVWPKPVPTRYADVPGQLQVDLRDDHGFDVRLPYKEDRESAIAAIRTAFVQERIKIHPRCRALIGNLKRGRYNNQRTDFQRTEAYGHCDPIMALVYGYRMADRTTNPFPARTIRRDDQLLVPYRTKDEQRENLERIADSLSPLGPFRRRP